MGDILTEFDQEAYDRHRRAEGRAEGMRTAKLEDARNLLKNGKLTIDEISSIVQLPVQEIESLK